MPKLYYRYGTMNSSKTANLMMVAHNYRSQNKNILLVKPLVDDRYHVDTINSRAFPSGIQADIILSPSTSIIELDVSKNIHCVLVDEAQFLSDTNIEALRRLTDIVPVICYGLRTDYRGKLFTGAKRLFELADTIEEIKTICVLCDRKAIINAKFYVDENGNKLTVRDGSDTIELGSEEKYQPMCYRCWKI